MSYCVLRTQPFLPYLATVKNQKIRSCDLDLFSGLLAVVKTHVPAKFHQAPCSGSWTIVPTKKKLWRKQNSPSGRRWTRSK